MMVRAGLIGALLLAASFAGAARAEALAADLLPAPLLAECEARAEDAAGYAPPIAAAAKALANIGAVAADDFDDARIGFCALRRAGGPVAIASCPDNVILLDEKYAPADQALALRATLAHEMTHHRQHRAMKKKYGAGYCASARYERDKPALEAAADAAGDAVAELFLLGREVEIVNDCDAGLLIYLEADDPAFARDAVFERLAPRGRALSSERAFSSRFRFYAETTPSAGPAHRWPESAGAQSRIIEGRRISLMETRLAAPANRETGAFTLRLSCNPRSR